MMDLEKLIAEAWEQERAKYAISGVGAGQHELTLRAAFNNANGGPPIAEGSYGHCERHLSALCARAVIKAMRDHTLVYRDDGQVVHQLCGAPDDIWKAILDSALEQP